MYLKEIIKIKETQLNFSQNTSVACVQALNAVIKLLLSVTLYQKKELPHPPSPKQTNKNIQEKIG